MSSASRSSSAERDGAIDELIVALPEAGLVDLLVNEIAQVDGVDVEDVRSISDPTRVARLDAARDCSAVGRGARRRGGCSKSCAGMRSSTSMPTGVRSCIPRRARRATPSGHRPMRPGSSRSSRGARCPPRWPPGTPGLTTSRGRRSPTRGIELVLGRKGRPCAPASDRSSRRWPASPTAAGSRLR